MTFSNSAVAHDNGSSLRCSTDNTTQYSHGIESYMTQDYLALSAATSVKITRERFFSDINSDYIAPQIFVIDDDGYLLGLVTVKNLLDANPDTFIGDIMTGIKASLTMDQPRHEASIFLKQAAINYIPVLNNGKIKGILGPQEIAQLKEDEGTLDSQLQGASSPLETPYLENSIFTLWRKRSVWLLLLFVAEAYTGTVIKSFEDQLETAIALAFFIPLLIGTGGNTGTQITSTLVRAMALGEIGLKDLGAILRKEVSAAVLIALTIGAAGFIRAWTLGVGMEVMVVVSLTLVAITVWSAIVSSIIPMLLRRVNIDPALVSAPFISTLIDGTGLIIYFQIAKVMLTI
ncbi:magnesium transporter [Citrobacter sp. JGM124]|nr:magnesium transporter [Citrobacter sp. JGM124]